MRNVRRDDHDDRNKKLLDCIDLKRDLEENFHIPLTIVSCESGPLAFTDSILFKAKRHGHQHLEHGRAYDTYLFPGLVAKSWAGISRQPTIYCQEFRPGSRGAIGTKLSFGLFAKGTPAR